MVCVMKHTLLSVVAALFITQGAYAPRSEAADAPNVIIIFTDDQGYADVGCFGAKDIATPTPARLAKRGFRPPAFPVSRPFCRASRPSLPPGCYATRLGIHGALGPGARHGISA